MEKDEGGGGGSSTTGVGEKKMQDDSGSGRTKKVVGDDEVNQKSTYSLKNAFAICSMRMCGWPWSWTTRMPSHVRRMPQSS
jgi:hypothetical protein